MRDEVRDTLAALIAEHGEALARDPRRCQGLLRDLCPDARAEVAVLSAAAEEGVPDRLLTMSAPADLAVAGLASQLVRSRGLSDEAATWAVQSWSRALRGGPPIPTQVEEGTDAEDVDTERVGDYRARSSRSGVGHGTAEPGWYDDPGGGTGHRWWDGTSWTTTTRAVPTDAAPVDARRRSVIVGVIALLVLIGGGAAIVALLGDDDVELVIDGGEDAVADDRSDDGEPGASEPEPDTPSDGTPEHADLGFADQGTVTVLHASANEDYLRGVLDAFMREFPGIDVQDEGTFDFEQLARSRVEGGDPPDIILAPAPVLIDDLARQGVVAPLDGVVDVGAVADVMPSRLLFATQRDGQHYGLPLRIVPKSIVWYRADRFTEQGYEPPGSFDELLALTDRMIADGNTPWCIGIESGAATGWVATDWMEDAVLARLGAEDYRRWIDGEVAFDSPAIREAVEQTMVPIWTGDDAVDGGRAAIAETNFGDAILHLFEDRCLMHRQASFAEAFFPSEAVYGQTFGFFPVPSIGGTTPMVLAGDTAALLTDDPAARTLMRWLATEAAAQAVAEGDGIPARLGDLAPDALRRPLDADLAAAISSADLTAFDASDQMPPSAGVDAFWSQMTSWIEGDRSLEEAFRAIDAAFP